MGNSASVNQDRTGLQVMTLSLHGQHPCPGGDEFDAGKVESGAIDPVIAPAMLTPPADHRECVRCAGFDLEIKTPGLGDILAKVSRSFRCC